MSQSSEIPAVVYASIDPFHAEAQGARLPDDSSYPAVPYSATARYVVTSDSVTGSAAIAISSLLQRNAARPTAAPTAAGVVTWTNNFFDVTNYSLIDSNYVNFRHVAWGVRIVATSAVSATSGQLYGVYLPNTFVNTWFPTGLPTTPDRILALPWSFVVPASELNNGAIICPSRRLDPSTTRYRAVGYPNAVAPLGEVDASDGWGTWVFILTGCGTLNPTSLLFEYVSRGEYTPSPTAIFATGTVYPACTPLMDAVVNITSEMPTTIAESDQPGVMDGIVRNLMGHASNLARRLGAAAGHGFLAGAASTAGRYIVRSAPSNWVREAVGVPRLRYPGY